MFAAGGGLPLASAFPLSCLRDSPGRSFHIPGRIANPSSASRGHVLRNRLQWDDFPLSREKRWDAVVVGGGVSGLAAMWKLKHAGLERILLLELEEQLGGTSRVGQLGHQSFPWGAHYINIPPREADCIHELLVDLDVIAGYDAAGRPQIESKHRLKWPRERLFADGEWREGFDPFSTGSAAGREVYRQFEDDMLRWALYTGRDGRRAFAMPLAYSSRDSVVRELDGITMLDYVRSRGWDSNQLDWFVNYACKDDYGSLMHQVSAWAGIHYYACRFYDRRIADQYPADTLTWEEGNGYLVRAMGEQLEPEQVRLNTAVVGVHCMSNKEAELAYIDLSSGERRRLLARTVVYAGKLHTAPHVVRGLPAERRQALSALHYSPWLVAAIQVSRLPDEPGARTAWDNVAYDSQSVGYIGASHPTSRAANSDDAGPSVLVYYLPFVDRLAASRHELLERDHAFWVNTIMTDLAKAHPGIEEIVERIDVYRWGHAMVRPVPGLIWGKAAEERQRAFESVSFATCDATGLPLFEEAVFAGVRAAEECLDRLGANYETSLPGLSRA